MSLKTVSTPQDYDYVGLLSDNEQCYTQYSFLPSTLLTPWMWQKMLIAICDSINFKGTSIAAHILGPAVVLVSTLVAKEKVVSFSDYQGNGTLL